MRIDQNSNKTLKNTVSGGGEGYTSAEEESSLGKSKKEHPITDQVKKLLLHINEALSDGGDVSQHLSSLVDYLAELSYHIEPGVSMVSYSFQGAEKQIPEAIHQFLSTSQQSAGAQDRTTSFIRFTHKIAAAYSESRQTTDPLNENSTFGAVARGAYLFFCDDVLTQMSFSFFEQVAGVLDRQPSLDPFGLTIKRDRLYESLGIDSEVGSSERRNRNSQAAEEFEDESEDEEVFLIDEMQRVLALHSTSISFRGFVSILQDAYKVSLISEDAVFPNLDYFLEKGGLSFLKSDREFMLRAVKQNPSNILMASDELRRDEELVIAALAKDPYLMSDLPQELINNANFMNRVLEERASAVASFSEEMPDDQRSEEMPDDQRRVVQRVEEAGQQFLVELQDGLEIIVLAPAENPGSLLEQVSKNSASGGVEGYFSAEEETFSEKEKAEHSITDRVKAFMTTPTSGSGSADAFLTVTEPFIDYLAGLSYDAETDISMVSYSFQGAEKQIPEPIHQLLSAYQQWAEAKDNKKLPSEVRGSIHAIVSTYSERRQAADPLNENSTFGAVARGVYLSFCDQFFSEMQRSFFETLKKLLADPSSKRLQKARVNRGMLYKRASASPELPAELRSLLWKMGEAFDPEGCFDAQGQIDMERLLDKKNPISLEHYGDVEGISIGELVSYLFSLDPVLIFSRTVLELFGEKLELFDREEYFFEVIFSHFVNNFQHLVPFLKGDREFMLQVVRHIPCVIQWASDELQRDEELLFAALWKKPGVLPLLPVEVQNDRVLMARVAEEDPQILVYASEGIRADKVIMLKAVKKQGRFLEYASGELKNDREVVLAAVTNDVYVFQYASNALKDDLEVVLTAVNQPTGSLRYASDRLRNGDLEKHMLEVGQRWNTPYSNFLVFLYGVSSAYDDKKHAGKASAIRLLGPRKVDKYQKLNVLPLIAAFAGVRMACVYPSTKESDWSAVKRADKKLEWKLFSDQGASHVKNDQSASEAADIVDNDEAETVHEQALALIEGAQNHLSF